MEKPSLEYKDKQNTDKLVTSTPPTYEYRNRVVECLRKRYSFLSVQNIGKSVLGRPIQALRLGDCSDGAVLLAAAFHANEWLTALLLLTFAEDLCAALDTGGSIAGIDCRKALLGHGVMIIPCVNPDGVEISLNGAQGALELSGEVERISGGCTTPEQLSGWSANARGVDLNRNYDAGWHISRQLERSMGVDSPSPRRYGGETPESEPETQAMVELCRRSDFRSVIAFHSQGEEIYWRYGDKTPSRSQLMARVFAVSSGYTLASPENIASHAGFKDWFISKFERPGFTVEIGKGKNPLPIEDLDSIYPRLEELLMLAAAI